MQSEWQVHWGWPPVGQVSGRGPRLGRADCAFFAYEPGSEAPVLGLQLWLGRGILKSDDRRRCYYLPEWQRRRLVALLEPFLGFAIAPNTRSR